MPIWQKLIPVFFGKGLYYTSDAKYADLYARWSAIKNGGEPRLFFNYVSFFSAYPVIDGDMAKLFSGPNFGNNDAHFTLVAPRTQREDDFTCYPIKPGQQAVYNELVVFQSHQVLPRYLVTLGPSGVKIKQLSVTHTQQELYNLIRRFNAQPEGPPYLRNSILRLGKKIPQQDFQKTLTVEQDWLFAHLSCLNPNCDPVFKLKVISKLLHYFLEMDPPEKAEERIVSALRSFYGEKEILISPLWWRQLNQKKLHRTCAD